MNMQTQSAQPQVERRKSAAGSLPKEVGWIVFLVVITFILGSGFYVSSLKLYKAGDAIGHNMGWVGGFMMLTLFLYPLRKRIGFMRNLGLLPAWFKWHMVFGILGPTLIMFHSTFHIGSVNAGVALVCMLLVSGSGIFGRFFYTKIHHGLYGRQASVNELLTTMEQAGDVKSMFNFAPDIERQLDEFRRRAESGATVGRLGLRNFISIGVQSWFVARRLVRELHKVMYDQAREKNWNDAQMVRLDVMYAEYSGHIRASVKGLKEVSQFHTYERLFSWWHIFHIPLVYMMVFSAIFHVVAIYMY